MMVYVPLSRVQAAQLRAGDDLGTRPGCASTPTLLADLGADSIPDEAEYAALSNAGVLALGLDGDPLRLVLAAEVAAAQVQDGQGPRGEVEVAGLRWSQVQALFADEPSAAAAVDRARRAVGGLVAPAVTELQESFDLLWFAVEELDGGV